MNLIIAPIMSAILGWLISWLFIKAIFMSWNGGVKKIINAMDVEQMITTEACLNEFETALPMIDTQFDQFFKQKLGEKMPMISMFIGEKTVSQLKEVFIEELKLLFPSLVHQFIEHAKYDFANNLSNKWRAILEPSLLHATRKYRIIATFIGLFWGIITQMLIHLL
jgi:hypothetical protein